MDPHLLFCEILSSSLGTTCISREFIVYLAMVLGPDRFRDLLDL